MRRYRLNRRADEESMEDLKAKTTLLFNILQQAVDEG